MKNGMTPLFTFDEMERWFDHFQSKAEDKMLVFLQAGGEKFVGVVHIKTKQVTLEALLDI
jgi:hypothetical protein